MNLQQPSLEDMSIFPPGEKNAGTASNLTTSHNFDLNPPSRQEYVALIWLALPVGNEGPSTFTGWYIGDETSLIPYESGQPVI